MKWFLAAVLLVGCVEQQRRVQPGSISAEPVEWYQYDGGR